MLELGNEYEEKLGYDYEIAKVKNWRFFTFDFPALAADTSVGINSLSPGPKILLGRIQQVKRPFLPFALITNFSPSALVSEYESLNWKKHEIQINQDSKCDIFHKT